MNKIIIMHVAQCGGGVARYLQSLIKYMDRTKFYQILVCSDDYREYDFKGIMDIVIYVKMQRSIGLQDIQSIKEVRRLIRLYKPDIVYSHSSKAGGIARLANLGIKNLKLYNPHGWSFNMKDSSVFKRSIYRYVEQILSLLTDKIIVVSEWEKNSAVYNHICGEKKIEVIISGVDVKYYEESGPSKKKKSAIGIPDNAFVIGSVARITVGKGPDLFVKAAKIIREKISNAFFIFVGDGEEREMLENYIKQFSLEDCFLITGWVDNTYEYISSFDVAVLLTRWEGFGLVVTEYMLSKKPIISSTVGGIPYIITNGKDGLLLDLKEMEDPQKIAEKIMWLFENPEKSNKIAYEGYKTVINNFDIRKTADRYNMLLPSLLNV